MSLNLESIRAELNGVECTVNDGLASQERSLEIKLIQLITIGDQVDDGPESLERKSKTGQC